MMFKRYNKNMVKKGFKNSMIVSAAVYVPNTPDSDGDVLTEEQIKEKMYDFIRNYPVIDIRHSLQPVNATILENYITMNYMSVVIDDIYVELPRGTWIMTIEIDDEQIIQDIKDKKLNGFSLMAIPKTDYRDDPVHDTDKSRRVLLKELGDFRVTHVSLVETPAVYDARFFSVVEEIIDTASGNKQTIVLKSKNDNNSVLSKIKSLLFSEKGKGEEDEMTKEELNVILEDFKEQIKTTVVEIVTKSVDPKAEKEAEVEEKTEVEETGNVEENTETTEETKVNEQEKVKEEVKEPVTVTKSKSKQIDDAVVIEPKKEVVSSIKRDSLGRRIYE